jgi:dTDP-4-amino-4,6-dideoxygalactose transaminase
MGVRETSAAIRTLTRGQLARYGGGGTSETSSLERELETRLGARHALAVNSGTSALICALVGVGVGPGDEVLVPAYTWVSTAAAVLAVGAVPVLVDIDESLTIDPRDIERKITPRTRAVIPVHMLNLVSDMDSILRIARDHDMFVVEDACQAVGVSYRGRRTGTIGDAGAYSFNQHKNIRSGEGGAVVTNDDRVNARAAMYHDVGSYTRDSRVETAEPLFIGMNFRMPELSSAILRPQLRRLDRQMKRRQKRRQVMLAALAGRPGLRVSPHHDPTSAAGLAVWFDDPEEARAFASARGVNRLIDTGRHIFTNWESMLARRTFHPAFDPYHWGCHHDREYCVADPAQTAPPDCTRTLEILERSCSITLDPSVPLPLFRLLARRIAR